MKINTLDSATKRPLVNVKIQLHIRGGKESGFVTVTTDQQGVIHLDDKYRSHQVSALFNGIQGAWTAANDGATLLLAAKAQGGQQGGGQSGGGQQRQQQGNKEKNKETWK